VIGVVPSMAMTAALILLTLPLAWMLAPALHPARNPG
jgi:hypothetical protein